MSSTAQLQFIPPTALADRVRAPGEPGYDEARRAWNLYLDQRPVAVAAPRTAQETATLVASAAAQGLRVAPQGTGHGAGPLGPLEDTVLLRTGRLDTIEIDPVARIARVGAGALWGEVTDAAAEHGLTGLAGSARDVGVVGYTLGGGLSWLARQFGLAVNHVRSIELVAPSGELMRASADEHQDVFYALRGAPGSFGVVTELELGLVDVPDVYAGMLLFGLARGEEVLNAWARWTDTVPESVTSLGRLLQMPPAPSIPEPLRGRSFVGVEAAMIAPQAQSERLLAPLRALGAEIDTFAMTPTSQLGYLHMDPPGPVPGVGDGVMLDSFGEDAVEALVVAAGENSGSPLLSLEVRHLGGAAARAPRGAGAVGRLEADYCAYGVGMAATAEMAEAVDTHLALVFDALAPWTARGGYINFTDRPSGYAEAMFEPAHYERLRRLKHAIDPADVLRANHEVAPLAP
jgi:FAD binding domain/Berberine and berberine like